MKVHAHAHAHSPAPAFIAADALTETECRKRPRASDRISIEEENNEEGKGSNGSNLMYALRRNPKSNGRDPDRDSSCLLGQGFDSKPLDSSIFSCDLNGKDFSSSKGLFGHMKFHSGIHQDKGDARSQKHETQEEEKKGSESEVEIETDHSGENSSRFTKRMEGRGCKKPRYVFHEHFASETNNEEKDMAKSLVLLARVANAAQNPQFQAAAKETGSGNLKHPNTGSQFLKCIRKKQKFKQIIGDAGLYGDGESKKAMYKCTTCNKSFHCHQALGGHRSSHNKVKACFSQIQAKATLEETKDSCVKARHERKTPRVHECSICHRVFSSGQALGGHKRLHWSRAGASDTVSALSSNRDTPMQEQQMPERVKLLDLNLPAPDDDYYDAGNLNNLGSNVVDSQVSFDAQTRSPPHRRSWLTVMSNTKQGVSLSSNHSCTLKNEEADGMVGK